MIRRFPICALSLQPGSSPRVCRRAAAGFTLIEVLVAMAVAVALCGAIASALILALREEARSADAGEMTLALRTAVSRLWLRPETAPGPVGAFEVERSSVETGEGDEKQTWDQWILFDPDRPSRRAVLVFPAVPAEDRVRSERSDSPAFHGASW